MISQLAFQYQRLVFFIVGALMAVGIFMFATLPALEDPPILVREAVITTSYPGLPPERVEQLITRPIEQAARQLKEIDEITASSLPGLSIVTVTLKQSYFDLDQIWDDLRNRVDAVRNRLPAGAAPPVVTSDIADVAVMTLAITGRDFTFGELGDVADHVRDRLYEVTGVKRIDISGQVNERIEVQLDKARLAELGLAPTAISRALQTQNVVNPGGQLDLGTRALLIEPTGDLKTVEQLRSVLVPTGDGQTVFLRDIATIERVLEDPPRQKAYVNGERAIVLAIAMLEGQRVLEFGPRLKAKVDELQAGLPVGYQLTPITYQAEVVGNAVYGVTTSVGQTILLVLGVVILLLGVRTGLIVGAIVPTVMLATVAVFWVFDVSLERMSLATLIIALGLFVDNAIVIGEDFRSRLGDGDDRDTALARVGNELALPLAASTATTVLVFLPLMLAPSSSGEYTRSISIVVAISLTISWFCAMTLIPILCYKFLKAPDQKAKRPLNERAFDPLRSGYRFLVKRALRHRIVFLLLTVVALFSGVAGLGMAPQKFFPDSDRAQLIAYLDLPPGVTSNKTDAAIQKLNTRINDANFYWMRSYASYVGYGGPRFVLSLTPVDPAPNRAVLVVNVTGLDAMDQAQSDLRTLVAREFPEMRAVVAKMFLGPSDSNVIEIQIRGPDKDYLYSKAQEVEALLRSVPGGRDISNDWEGRASRLVVEIDQARARDAGVTSAAIAEALSRSVSGVPVSEFREDNDVIPILLRGNETLRSDPAALETLPVARASGGFVPLKQVASIQVLNAFSRLERQGLSRAIIVEGRSTEKSAEDIAAFISSDLQRIRESLAPGHTLEVIGVVKESAEGGASIGVYMPLCFGLIFLLLLSQFNSYRRALIVMITMPLVVVGAAIGTHVMGASFGFMSILGILALFGIILNNGIVLIDRIDIERETAASLHEAIVEASARRLRPIIMATITTVLGLMPLILARDPLFYPFASVVAGGLIVGTILTLGVVPVLYATFFGAKRRVETGVKAKAEPSLVAAE
ncbi:MAG: efflux RND transporter permease subunit [Pseudomonadota bacterium]